MHNLANTTEFIYNVKQNNHICCNQHILVKSWEKFLHQNCEGNFFDLKILLWCFLQQIRSNNIRINKLNKIQSFFTKIHALNSK